MTRAHSLGVRNLGRGLDPLPSRLLGLSGIEGRMKVDWETQIAVVGEGWNNQEVLGVVASGRERLQAASSG